MQEKLFIGFGQNRRHFEKGQLFHGIGKAGDRQLGRQVQYLLITKGEQ